MVVDETYHVVLRHAADPEQLMLRAVRGLLELLGQADGASVVLRGADGMLHLVACSGTIARATDAVLDPGSTLSGQVMASGVAAICGDAEHDSRVDRATMDCLGIRSAMFVPLVHSEQVIGLLAAGSGAPHAFSGEDLRRCTAVAGVVAMVVATAGELAKLAGGYASYSSAMDGSGKDDMEAVARFVTCLMEPSLADLAELRHRVERIIATRAMEIVVQPMVHLASETVVTVEALSRFAGQPVQSPDRWFADAERVGLGVELELCAAAKALDVLGTVPDPLTVAVNVGPEALGDPRFLAMLERCDAHRVVIELTEHIPVDDYPRIRATVDRLRLLGARLSVDDAGAGYASFSHIVQLAPELIKLDRSLIAGIDADLVRRALAGALVGFAHQAGAEVVAEGIETEAELAAVRALGIDYGQGFYLGRPGSVASALQAGSVGPTAT